MTADDIDFEEFGVSREPIVFEDDEDDSFTQVSQSTQVSQNYGNCTNTTTTTVTTSSGSTLKTTYYGSGTHGTVSSVQTTPLEAFDLTELGIITTGTFDPKGNPVGWSLNPGVLPSHYPSWMNTHYVLRLDAGPEFRIYIRGIYSKYFTNQRRAAMGLSPL